MSDTNPQKNITTTILGSPTLPNDEMGGADVAPVIDSRSIDVTQEYVASGNYSWYGSRARALPSAFDDLTAKFGADFYDQMLIDEQVLSGINTLKVGVLEGDLQFTPVDIDDQPELSDLAEQITDFCKRVLEDMDTNTIDWLWDMLDCIVYGNKVSEMVFALKPIQLKEKVQNSGVQGTQQEDPTKTPQGETRDQTAQTSATNGKGTASSEKTLSGSAKNGVPFASGGFPFKRSDGGNAESTSTDKTKGSDQSLDEEDSQDPELESIEDKPTYQTITKDMLVIQRINVKSYKTIRFVVDAYFNVLGFVGVVPGKTGQGLMSTIVIQDGASLPKNFFPREKFAVLTFRPKDNDPRGTSVLRAAYDAWWMKHQILPEWLKALSQFASGILIGKTPKGANPSILKNSDGTPVIGAGGLPVTVTAQDTLLELLKKIRNGSVGVVPAETEIEILSKQTSGEDPFQNAFDILDSWITIAILHQTLATNEGEHMARAAAQVHKAVMDLIIQLLKNNVARMIRRDVLMKLVEYNYGEFAKPLTPNVSLGEVEQQDFSSLATAIATLFNAGFISPLQLQHIDAMLGLPARSTQEVMRLIKQEQNGAMLADASTKALAAQQNDSNADEDQDSESSGNPFKKKEVPFSATYEKELQQAEAYLERQINVFFSKQRVRVT